MSATDLARSTFQRHLVECAYPGRGLVIGRERAGEWVLVYWIMGRSENSRNRRFVADGGAVRTEPVDLSKVADPSLIIYDALLEVPGVHIVSNGDQTRTIRDALLNGGSFESALMTREREPDAPNWTPRISGVLDVRGARPAAQLAILKANACDPEYTDRWFFRPAPPPAGIGHGLTTYMGDGNPLPSFTGDPLLLPLDGGPEEILDSYWDALDADNRISLAVKCVSAHGNLRRLLVRNRHGDA